MDDSTVEQRCARIRGRMVWILSQLEGDSTALTDLSNMKLGGGDQLHAQQEAHERELDEELERQASRLQAEHEAELDELRARMAAQHASEVSSMRAEVVAAKETARQAQSATQTASRDARLDAERQRGAAEAAHRAELLEARKRTAALEDCLREAAPLLSLAAAAAPELSSQLAAVQRSFEALLPGIESTKVEPQPSTGAVAATTPAPPRSSGTKAPSQAADTEMEKLSVRTPATGAAKAAVAAKAPPMAPPPAPPAAPAVAKERSFDKAASVKPPPAPPRPVTAAQPSAKSTPTPPPPPPPPPGSVAAMSASKLAPPPSAAKAAPPKPPTPKMPTSLAKPRADGPGKQPPPQGPALVPVEYGYTHPGGSKPLDAKNQDTWFVVQVDDHNAVYGVLDGHGSQNGTLVAEVAAKTIKTYLTEHFNRLRTEPEAVFNTAFEMAHDASRQAVLEAEDGLKVVDGVPVDEWEDEDGELRQEAADGGTTATIIALLDGATLVHAQVGDSSALLGGTLPPDEDGGEPEVAFEELMEEHSATNAEEYTRVVGTGPRGKLLQFVYDVPGLIDEGKAPHIFKKGADGYELDIKSKRLAEVHGTPAKNARGDLPAILLTPDEDPTYGEMEPQSLAMTRSIGDFYMHTFGVTWRPEVISVDLAEQCAGLEHLTLILCSDGIWDLWEYEDVFHAIAQPPGADGQGVDAASRFFNRSVDKGAEMFEDTADNMTGIVVYLNPKSVPRSAARPSSKPAAETPAKSASKGGADPSLFSV